MIKQGTTQFPRERQAKREMRDAGGMAAWAGVRLDSTQWGGKAILGKGLSSTDPKAVNQVHTEDWGRECARHRLAP